MVNDINDNFKPMFIKKFTKAQLRNYFHNS